MNNNQILIKTSIEQSKPIKAKLESNNPINASITSNHGSGTTNYELLSNKPSINEVTLIGNKTTEDLRLQGKMEAMTIQEVQYILYNNEQRRRNNG